MKRALQSLDSLAPFMFLDLVQFSFHFNLLLIATHSSVFATFMGKISIERGQLEQQNCYCSAMSRSLYFDFPLATSAHHPSKVPLSITPMAEKTELHRTVALHRNSE